MRDTRVEEVEQISSDSDSDPECPRSRSRAGAPVDPRGKHQRAPTVGIFSNSLGLQGQAPTYLIFDSQVDMDKWLYELTLVSGGDGGRGTPFEQYVQALMETEGGEEGVWASPVWRNPVMTHSKDPITTPLTTFTSDVLQAEALKLFKVFFLDRQAVGYSLSSRFNILPSHFFSLCNCLPR